MLTLYYFNFCGQKGNLIAADTYYLSFNAYKIEHATSHKILLNSSTEQLASTHNSAVVKFKLAAVEHLKS